MLCVYFVDFGFAPDLQKNCKVVFKERHERKHKVENLGL